MIGIKNLKTAPSSIFSGLFNLEGKIGRTMFIRKGFTRLFLKRRARLPVNRIEILSKEIPFHLYLLSTSELHKSNDWYGIATILKQYAGVNKHTSIKACIEHGLYLSDDMFDQDVKSDIPTVITMGKNRLPVIKKLAKKKAVAIGPYIHYAKSSLSKRQFIKEKQRLKKNLLVFPVHSTGASKVEYDINNFCEEIKRVGKNFDNIRICLYWKDVQHGLDRYFQKEGFECITAGYMLDPMFLPRLKSMIELSDFTMSTEAGTHVGYCLLLKKPHYIFSCKKTNKGDNKEELKLIEKIARSPNYKLMNNAFDRPFKGISQRQYDITNRLCGLDQTKSPQELRKIFQQAEKSFVKIASKKNLIL